MGAASAAFAQKLMFTSQTHLNSPVTISAISRSKQVGFDYVTFHNDSRKTVEAVRVEVKSSSGSGEEVTLEGADFLVMLDPGGSKRVSVGLGRIRELTARAKSLRQRAARAILVVTSAKYSDGTEWNSDDPAFFDSPIYDPLRQ